MADIGAAAAAQCFCLRFPAFGETELAKYAGHRGKQYRDANNMTDALAALFAVAAQLPCRDTLMQEYDDK